LAGALVWYDDRHSALASALGSRIAGTFVVLTHLPRRYVVVDRVPAWILGAERLFRGELVFEAGDLGEPAVPGRLGVVDVGFVVGQDIIVERLGTVLVVTHG
jgi:hypothetical protein